MPKPVRLRTVLDGLHSLIDRQLNDRGLPKEEKSERVLAALLEEVEDLRGRLGAIARRLEAERSGMFAQKIEPPDPERAAELRARALPPPTAAEQAQLSDWLAAEFKLKRAEDLKYLREILPAVLAKYPVVKEASAYLVKQLQPPPYPPLEHFTGGVSDVPGEARRAYERGKAAWEKLTSDPRSRFLAALNPQALTTLTWRIAKETGWVPPISPKAKIKRDRKDRQRDPTQH